MASVSSLGLSGLPLTDLLDKLKTNESQVLNTIKSRQTAAEAKLSAYSKLKSAVDTFQKAAQAVGKESAFGAVAAKSGSDAISASADSTAIPGQYSIQVDKLASNQTLVYAGRADRTADIGTGGTLKITIDGTEKSLDLSGKGTSLNDLVAAINADKDIGVNATVVNDGTPGSQYRLLLTSRETGTQNAVTNITVDDNADLDAFLGYSGGGSTAGVTVQDATNAELSINGIAVTSQSNTIENVIDGVKLTLNQTTTSAANLALTRDDSAAKKAVQDFVSSYNSLLSTIKTLTAYDTDAQTSSALTGDSLARTVQTRMRDAISGAFDATNGTSLSKIGITTNPTTGQLSIDDTKLTQALSDNLDGVKSLFTSGTGIGSRVDAAATAFTKTDGIFSTTTTGLSKTIEDIKKQYDATSDRIDQRMETYRAQFTQLDTMVSQMNTLSSYLSQQLSALSSSKS
ncbi:Flagellar hook-associated protein FliD [Castellaniella defragrans 65Phen]|uniref:Flagellar hook-associated protein 2 n=2 Tax=Castellaniella defragrans TaxID=75697 RepID=W8X515_CASD6|nr:flagellar filament capping protein FliD [Castellaniella defragrans]KAB0604026.1 flagellar filament capping protein FliD [Castellaniella defragrans]MBB6082374.1 flagellar hook-associated protein 2 [Castellaniella defragrans]CDM24796.1 Flagellar hook-associated protein FliD [Castellaniella defragrans 65Phen]